MPTMCRLVTLLTLASAVSRSVAYEEPDCPLQNDVDFAESSAFDPNLPLTFGGGIVIEMNVTTPSSYSKNARVFSFSNYGKDVVRISVVYGAALYFGVSRGSGSVSGITSRYGYNGVTLPVRAVVLPGSTADSTTGKCFLYINGTLSSYGDCPLPTFVERRANFIGHDLDDSNPTFQGTVANFTLKACQVTPSVPTPLPYPQCLLQNDVDFAESSAFDPNLPLTFGGGIVIEMTVTTPSSYSKNARVFSFSNYGKDVVRISVVYGAALYFGVSRGSAGVTGIESRYGYNSATLKVRAVILPGSTADSTTGQCFLYINNVLEAYSSSCQIPTFVERRANFIGHDLDDSNPTFQGTVANFTLKACNLTPSVPTPLPSPQCLLQNDVNFAESSAFDPNIPLTFGGGIVIEMTVTTPSSYSKNARVFSFSNYGKDVVRISVVYGAALYFGVSRGSAGVTGIESRYGYNSATLKVRAVVLPGSTADSTTGKCFLYINNVLEAYSSSCQIPTFVERRANFIGHDLDDSNPTFQGTVANFTLKACNVTPSVPTPLPSPQCLLQNDVNFAESSAFDPNLPLTFGGGIVIEMTVTTPSSYSKNARVFSFSNYGKDVVRISVVYGAALYFGVSRGSAGVTGIESRYGYNSATLKVRAVILPGSTADSTTGKCFLYINNVLEAYSSSCQIPTFVERRANFIGHDLDDSNPTFQGTVANFTLKACNLTPSVPTPLPSPQCLLQNDVNFAESSAFDPNIPLTFGGGIVIEMTVTTPSSYSKNARVFSFSNYGKDVVRISVVYGAALYFGVSRGSAGVTGIESRYGYNSATLKVRAVVLPGSTADSTTGKCFLYINNVLEAYSSSCQIPTFVERRANFIGHDLDDSNPTFQGTVANFTLKACNVTPSVPTPLPSPQCLLQNDVNFAESSAFDPNLPLTFGGGIVIEMTVTTPSSYSKNARVFSFSNYGKDVVRISVVYGAALYFGVSRGSAGVTGIESRYGYNSATLKVRAVILPGSTADSTTGKCFLYINNVLEAYSSSCQIPTFVERRANFIGHDLDDSNPTFQGTVANFTLKACNLTPSVPTPLPSPQCLLQNDVNFAESSAFDPNIPLTFGGGIVIEMTVTTPSSYSKNARVFSFSNYGKDVVRISVVYGAALYFGVSRGSAGVTGITSRYGYNSATLRVRAVILPGSTADSTTGWCFLYINNVLEAYSSNCQIPMRVVRKANFIGHDTDSSNPTFQGTVANFSMRSCNGSVDTSAPATAVPFTALPSTLAPDTAAPPPRTAHPVPPGDSAAPMVPTAVPTDSPKGVATAPTAVPTTAPVVVPTAVPKDGTAFDETDAPTTAAPEKDDSGTPWWVCVMIGLGTLLVLLVGGVLLCFCRRGNATSPPTVDSHHIQAETDHGAAELLYHGVDDEPQLAV